MIKINLVNEYSFSFNLLKVTKKIAKAINKEEKLKGKHYISIIIVDNEKIHEINKEYRNIDRPTDVISFALGDGEAVLPEELGDIFISFEKANEQAKEYGHSLLREVSFLITHGILHLLGYDHQIKEDEERMFKKQEIILERLGITR